MKRLLIIALLLITIPAFGASDFTANLNLERPAQGDVDWASPLRENWAILDTAVGVQHNTSGEHTNVRATILSGDTVVAISSLTVPNSINLTPDTVGQLGISTNVPSINQGTFIGYDGQQVIYGVVTTNTPDNAQVPIYNSLTGLTKWGGQAGAAGGDSWSDAVDSDILPTGADNTYDLGSAGASFKDIFWDGTATGNVTGALTGNADTVTTNANLTGEVTSTGNATVLDKTAITNQSLVTAVGADTLLIIDATDGLLKKALASDIAGSSGAPSDATYITQTPNGTLSAEQALSALSTGIMRVATTTGVVTSLTDSAGIAANIDDETGTTLLVFNTSPTLITPALGTPSALVGTNISGTGSGFTAGNVTTNANLTGEVTSVGNSSTIADSITVTGWVMGASTATTPSSDDNDTSLATTAWCETTQNYAKNSELHTRSHTMTSTSDHTAGNWKAFYSNDAGQVIELALGADGTVYQSNGAAVAPTFEAPTGGGDLKADGTVPLTANWDVGNYDMTMKAATGDGIATFATFNSGGFTASEILGTDASKNIISLPVATYPSFTELSYIKGITSAIQTQLDGKAAALGVDDNYVTDAEKVVIGNTSGTNTGDNASASTTVSGIVELATTAEANTGTDATRAVTPDALRDSNYTPKIYVVRLLAEGTAHTVDTSIGGDFRMPFGGTIIAVGAYVDTAGVTGTATIDINEAGTTILSTLITIDTAEKSSKTAAAPPVISDTSYAVDAILTYEVTVLQTTPALGLTIWIAIIPDTLVAS